MLELGLLLSILVSVCAGTCVGFCAGLVPGLHMNNIAAAMTAYAGVTLAFFGVVSDSLRSDSTELVACCFISSALVAHLFAESITSTYLGIPAGDVVSVLPAHRLARAGLGRIAVRASVDGSFEGIVLSCLVLLPVCLLMGPPANLYSFLRGIMGFLVVVFSVVLVVSEGSSGRDIARATILFLASGVLGSAVLLSDFNGSVVPDVPWIGENFVPRSALLLPLFAGLFGVPSLLNGLTSRQVLDISNARHPPLRQARTFKDYFVSLVGGATVGWLPGMTSGSAATLCVPRAEDSACDGEIESSGRFIWLYSFISASGAVFAVGALFVILRARSGSMDAVQFFIRGSLNEGDLGHQTLPLASILLSMLAAAILSRSLLNSLDSRLSSVHRVLCSKEVAVASLLFVISLSAGMTGFRGMLVMSAAVCLGLLPQRLGVRRIQLMGCLLVPIAISFFI